MSRSAVSNIARALALAAILASMWAALRFGVAAQDAEDERGVVGTSGSSASGAALTVALARICVAESGWHPETGDCAAITHLLVRRAELLGIAPLRLARLYSGRHFDSTRTDQRRWIVGLELHARRPDGWPRTLDWEGFYRARGLEALEHARDVLRGEVEDPCPGSVHFGGPMDDARAIRAGWRRVECSAPVRNHFWSVPRRGDAT